jgi:hypothetical protein
VGVRLERRWINESDNVEFINLNNLNWLPPQRFFEVLCFNTERYAIMTIPSEFPSPAICLIDENLSSPQPFIAR